MVKPGIYAVLALIIVVLAGCNSNSATENSKKIVGRWVVEKHVSIVNAYDEKGEKDTVEIDEGKYYKELKIKPAEIEYGAEGVYLLVAKDYEDVIKMRKPGTWKFEQDTLVMQWQNDKTIDKYKVDMTDSTMVFYRTMDFDDDGAVDDSYAGFYRKMVR